MRNKIVLLLAAAVFAASCGVSKKSASQSIPVPTQAQADSIMGLQNAVVFVREMASGPVIYAFAPHVDSALVDIHQCKVQAKNGWTKDKPVSFPCGPESGYTLVSGPESMGIRNFGGAQYLTFTFFREKGSRVQKMISMYQPEQDVLNCVTFEGKRRSDGKVYGCTDLSMQNDKELPQKVWADSVLVNTPGFVALGDDQIMSDQAIEWWLEKNPGALSKASKITFGSLPAESSLVQQYKKTSKETGPGYRVALFDTVDYTIIVAQNRSTGAYSLVWVEPVCKNPKKDRLLNNIYFTSGNTLALFYYKGSQTFKYKLSLANGQLQR